VRHEIIHNPDFGAVRITFEQAGEQILTESGAMLSRDNGIQMKTNMQGGIGSALKRTLLGGESLFQNTYTATAPNQSLMLAPAPEGNIEQIEMQQGADIFLQSGSYLASAPTVTLDTKWQGAKGFFSGGLFLLRATGVGPLWFSTYGGMHIIDIGPDSPHQSYICDNSHMVAFTAGLQYNVRKLGGLKSLFLSGEGLICEFTGQGRLWIQTRNPSSLASFLHPFRPVKAKSN
jgi:uncharacterized protein (TIGR00266 family)